MQSAFQAIVTKSVFILVGGGVLAFLGGLMADNVECITPQFINGRPELSGDGRWTTFTDGCTDYGFVLGVFPANNFPWLAGLLGCGLGFLTQLWWENRQQ
jgi:hypothetical protein